MTKIRIVAESSFGHNNQDISIEVPDRGELAETLDCKSLPNMEPKKETFTEYLGETDQRINAHTVKSFQAIGMRPFYLLWMENRGEWVGVKFDYMGSNSEPDSVMEHIETAGPYRLGEDCAKLIKSAYKSKIPLENVLHTPPSELKSSRTRMR
jgi:hypothetical protein